MSKLKFKITAKIVNLDSESCETSTVFIPKRFSPGSAACFESAVELNRSLHKPSYLTCLTINKIVSTYRSEFVW